jgi:hypothetical protein
MRSGPVVVDYKNDKVAVTLVEDFLGILTTEITEDTEKGIINSNSVSSVPSVV